MNNTMITKGNTSDGKYHIRFNVIRKNYQLKDICSDTCESFWTKKEAQNRIAQFTTA